MSTRDSRVWGMAQERAGALLALSDYQRRHEHKIASCSVGAVCTARFDVDARLRIGFTGALNGAGRTDTAITHIVQMR